MMDITGSLQFGLIVLLIAVLVSHVTTIFRVVGSWITWCKDIRYLYSLPSPPGRWLSGNALEVSSWLTKGVIYELSCKTLKAHNFYPKCSMAVMCSYYETVLASWWYSRIPCLCWKIQGYRVYMYISHILQSCETTKDV